MEGKIKTLLVDDEFLALQLLEKFAEKAPELEIIDKVKSPMQALEILNREPVDLLFLDIQMPGLSGNNLLRTLRRPPATIFTTAYSEYATEAFDLDAVDYLLKPFAFERFLKAVNKAKDFLQARQVDSNPASTNAPDFMTAKVDGKIVKVYYRDILFIEGLKEYVRIVCQKNRYVTLESLHNLENKLPRDDFLRVHKSYIVALPKVEALLGNMLEIGQHQIPISRGKREEVVRVIFRV